MEIADLVAPDDRDRSMANIREGRESAIEDAILLGEAGRTRDGLLANGLPRRPSSPFSLSAECWSTRVRP